MPTTRVAVLRGGPSSKYLHSLRSGNRVLKSLSPERYEPRDIFISRDGTWHEQGIETTPAKVLHRVDVAVNAMHREYGEDGAIQHILESFSIPYTGTRSAPASAAWSRLAARQALREHEIRMPYAIAVNKEEWTEDLLLTIFRAFPMPAIVKPVMTSASARPFLADSFEALAQAVEHAFLFSPTIIIEEFIRGREATCGVIDHFRGQEDYALFPVEIDRPAHAELLDYELDEHLPHSRFHCPGHFSDAEKQALQGLAIKAHKALGLRHYSRSDFVVHPKRGVYLLETVALPLLTDDSLFLKSVEAVGSGAPEFFHHVISLALEDK